MPLGDFWYKTLPIRRLNSLSILAHIRQIYFRYGPI